MARIAGVYRSDEGRVSDLETDIAAVAVLLRNPGRETHRLAINGHAEFLWQGSENVGLARHEETIAVVDGTFFSVGDFGKTAKAGYANLLLDLYRVNGFAGAISRINGDFAAALYDGRSGTLWLGRDRVGQRPLYYVLQPGRVAFCSRPSPLLALSGVSAAVNRRYVAVFAGSHYRYLDNRPDESPFADVCQLPAASVLEIRPGESPRIDRYWQLTDEGDYTEDELTLATRYRELLLDAVGTRIAAVERPAFTLSGGMDSSSVLACATEASRRQQHAFSCVYTDQTYDESNDIKEFIGHGIAQWHVVPVENFDLFDTIRRMVRAHDEPVATATWLSHFLLCEHVAAGGFDTLFGGLGGDELNAGEYEYFAMRFADLRQSGKQSELAHEIECWARYHDHPIYRKDREVAESLMDRLADFSVPGRVRVERSRMTRYYTCVSRDYFDLATFEPVLDHPYRSYLKNRSYQDIFRETAPCCLRAEDRNSDAFGLRHVDPFFDYRLIEFMFRIPGHMKIRDGITKRLLRTAMKGLLPEETRTRIKKTGWNAPAHLWFTGKRLAQLLDLVHSRGFRERGVYNVDEVERVIEEHRSIVASGAPRENHMMFLWQLVNLELWFQEVVDRKTSVAGNG